MLYSKLVEVYEQLDSTTKRLAYTSIISSFLKDIPVADLSLTLLLLEGRIFPRWDEREIGVASKLVVKALNLASGEDTKKIENEWKKTGDLGSVAFNLFQKRKQATLHFQTLTVAKVMKNLRELATIQGLGTVDKKLQLIAELLTSSTAIEAKFIARTILNDLRVGVGEGTLRDSIVWAYFGSEIGVSYDEKEKAISIPDREVYNRYVDAVQRAYDLNNEFGPVAEIAKTKGIKGLLHITLTIGTPVKVMLALKVETLSDGFERCGKPAAFEYKYDGMRIQIHKDNDSITLYTRRLENVTYQFPDVVKHVKEYVHEKKVVLDAEAVGYSKTTGHYLPFQQISQRIQRKYDIESMAEQFPVEVNVFDIIYYKDKEVFDQTYQERRKIIERIIEKKPKKITVAQSIITGDENKAASFYQEALASGNEGLMIKKLDAPYVPGARVGYMVKLKPTKENLDLVIVKAEWGEGKRSKWLSSYTLACRDEKGSLLELGKASTGLKEKSEEGLSFDDMTELLRPLIIKEEGKEAIIKPKLVIEIAYEEIQKSPTYSSGYALRFPRVIQVRCDRGINDITELSMVEKMFNGQVKIR